MKRATRTLGLLLLCPGWAISGQQSGQAQKSEMQCRDLSETHYLVGPDETLVDGKVCKVVKKPALVDQAPEPPVQSRTSAADQQSGGLNASVQDANEKGQPGQALTNDAILRLANAGLGEDTIASMVSAQPGKYSLAADDIIALKKAGVPEKVIAAMLNTASSTAPQALAAAPPPVAADMERQYKACAKHYIPVDRCTREIYRQLKIEDEAPLEPNVLSALNAVKGYQRVLKNPASMQVHTAYVTDRGDICLEIGGQNTLGGFTVSRVVYTSKGRWLDEGGFLGALAQEGRPSGGVDRWPRYCVKGFHLKMVPGTDVTEKVNQALKDGR